MRKFRFVLLLGLCFSLAACRSEPEAEIISASLTIAVDTSVGQVAEGLLNAYEVGHPDVVASLLPHTRQSALVALVDGEVDAVLLFYPPEETDLFYTPIAYDLLAVITSPESGGVSLSLQEIRAIFTGQIIDETPMTPVIRELGSSSSMAFAALVPGESPFSTSALLAFSDTQVLDIVSRTPESIGVIPYSLYNGSVGIVKIDGSAPSFDDLRDQSYPLRIPIVLVTGRQPQRQEAIRDFLDWVLSEEGQAVVRRYMLRLDD